MSDLISRKAILEHIEKIRQDMQMMDDTHRASIVMNGMYLCEKAVMNQPSVQHEAIQCKCKDCPKREYCRTATAWAVVSGDDWHCANAERRAND